MNFKIIRMMVAILAAVNQFTCNAKDFNCDRELLANCKCSEHKDNFIVDCSNSGVKSVPTGIPSGTTHLYLNNNEINVLHNNSFAHSKRGLPDLVTLSIRSNAMSKVEMKALNGLHHLKELDLYNNSLKLKDSFPMSVFIPIRDSLEVLDFRRNLLGDISQMDYPVAVGELVTLKELRIDCLGNKSFPMEYGKLKNLTKLSFTGGRKDATIFLRDDMFKAVSNSVVTDVNLGDLNIILGSHTLSNLPKLITLDLSNNLNGIDLKNIVSSLKNTAIQTLKLNGSLMFQNVTDSLKTLGELHLKQLIMDHNLLKKLDPVFSKYLPELEILSLGENNIYFEKNLLTDLGNLKHLIGLNLSWNINYPTGGSDLCEAYIACPLLLPPKLKWIDISHIRRDASYFPEIALIVNSTLRSVDLSSNAIIALEKPIYCAKYKSSTVFPQIETINFNNNSLQCINLTFFSHCDWSSLTHLHLRNNQLGGTEGNVCNQDKYNTLGFLKPAINLEYLDLAGNQIQDGNKLSEIQGLTKLKVVDLSMNKLSNFSLSLENMTGLLQLNLSNNNISCFSMSTIFELNKLQKLRTNSNTLEVDLSENLLSCTCECLDFLQWMMTMTETVTNWKTYECEFNDGTKKSLDRLPIIVAALETQCFGTQWLKLYISSGIFNYTLITIICLSYRGRRTIKSLLNVYWRLNALKENKNTRDESKYVFSAFVSCDHRDAKYFVYRKLLPNLETKESKLTFCIAQRNFLVGATIIDNIIRAISKSRKVIFIVSQYFLTSKWCQEELMIAHQASMERDENVIICIFMPNINLNQLPRRLKTIVKTVTCLKWCPDPKAQKVFWVKLQEGLEEGNAKYSYVVV